MTVDEIRNRNCKTHDVPHGSGDLRSDEDDGGSLGPSTEQRVAEDKGAESVRVVSNQGDPSLVGN